VQVFACYCQVFGGGFTFFVNTVRKPHFACTVLFSQFSAAVLCHLKPKVHYAILSASTC